MACNAPTGKTMSLGGDWSPTRGHRNLGFPQSKYAHCTRIELHLESPCRPGHFLPGTVRHRYIGTLMTTLWTTPVPISGACASSGKKTTNSPGSTVT